MLTTAALLTFAMQCAPTIHPDTISDIAKTESGLNPYAIAEIVPIKGGRSRVISYMPSSKEAALKIVEEIKQRKHRYSVGVMQITSTNFSSFDVDANAMFNPCNNLSVAEKIITDCYQRGETLKRMLSCYYSGNFNTGQRPEKKFGDTSYIQRIGYVVPSTRQEREGKAAAVATSPPLSPSSPSFESWDVLREYPRENHPAPSAIPSKSDPEGNTLTVSSEENNAKT